METWTLGRNLPACLSRSGLTSMEAQIIGNLFENLTYLPDPLRMQVQSHIMHGHDHTQHSAQRGGIRRSSVEGLAACLLGVPRWKARVWKAKYDKDHAAFGACIQKRLITCLQTLNLKLRVFCLRFCQVLVPKMKRKKRTVMSTSLMCEEDCSTNGNSMSNIQWECVWPNCQLCGM